MTKKRKGEAQLQRALTRAINKRMAQASKPPSDLVIAFRERLAAAGVAKEGALLLPPKPPDQWTADDKRAMVAEIRAVTFHRYDGPPPTSDEDDPGWIVPDSLVEPEPVDDPEFIQRQSNAALKMLPEAEIRELPSPQDLFDVADRENRCSPALRFRTCRLMAQRSRPDIGKVVERTLPIVRRCDLGKAPIPEAWYNSLSWHLSVNPGFLRTGAAPFPVWLTPWARAVRGLALAARWMVNAGLSIPGVLLGPPGPGNPFMAVVHPKDYQRVLVPSQVFEARDPMPVGLAIRYLTRLDEYLKSLRPEERRVWLERYGDAVIYLPYLPYVWTRMGALVYGGEIPFFKPRKQRESKKDVMPVVKDPAPVRRKYNPKALLGPASVVQR